MIEASKEIVAALKAAVAAVDEAKVPKELRASAFSAAFYGRAGGTSQGSPKRDPASGPRIAGADGHVSLEQIADKLEISPALAGIVYDVDEDGVHLTVKRSTFNATKKFAQQEVTYLVVAGRQASRLDEWTSVKSIIETTHDRGVNDTNVSKAISALDGDGLRFRGTGGKREVKMNAVGFSKAADIVKRIAEAS